MAKVRSILDMIGNTPMVKLSRMAKADDAEVWVKLEASTPRQREGPHSPVHDRGR